MTHRSICDDYTAALARIAELEAALAAEKEGRRLAESERRTRPWLSPSERRHLADMIDRAITTGPHPPIGDAYAMGGFTLREMLLEIPGDLDAPTDGM